MLLCAASLYPDPKTYLGFTMCLIKDYEDIPRRALIEDCALEHAIDFEKLSDCASQDDGALGVDMLRSSVRRSAEVRNPFRTPNRNPNLDIKIHRLVSPRAVRSDWTRRSTVSGTTASGRTVPRGRESTT